VRRAILLLALCQVVWSFGGVVIRWTTLPVTTLIPLALVTAGTLLAVSTPRRRLRLPSWRLRAEALGFGLANGLANMLTGLAVVLAGIGNAAFGFASLPLWLVLVARPLVGDRVPPRAIPALALGGVGIGLLLLASRGSAGGNHVFLGTILAILAAVAGSISALAGRRLVPHIGVQATAAWTMLTGGLLLLPLLDWRSLAGVALWTLPVLLAWVALHYIVTPLLYNRMSLLAPAFMLAVATFINPAAAPVWGLVFYGERVAPLAVAGLALALGANVLLLLMLRAAQTGAPSTLPDTVEPAYGH
jgi:drug/metabolite transporter (DMT)-like permease